MIALVIAVVLLAPLCVLLSARDINGSRRLREYRTDYSRIQEVSNEKTDQIRELYQEIKRLRTRCEELEAELLDEKDMDYVEQSLGLQDGTL